MATHKHHTHHEKTHNEQTVEKLIHFWERNKNIIIGVAATLIIVVGGYFGYKNFVVKPREVKAQDAIYVAERLFAADSVSLALNGYGTNPGFLNIIKKYSGSKTANLAKFYAGMCYIKLEDNQNAVKYLKDFKTDSKLIQSRAYKLLGDAYGDLQNYKEAISYYQKAVTAMPDNDQDASESLFMAGMCAYVKLKDNAQAIKIFKELKEKYPNSQYGFEAVKYLGMLGDYQD